MTAEDDPVDAVADAPDDSDANTDAVDDTDASTEADEPEYGYRVLDDGTRVERGVPPERWEDVGRRALATVLRHQYDEVGIYVEQAIAAIEFGCRVDADHVEHLRRTIAVLEATVEEELVALVDDAEPWERTADRVPVGQLWATLDPDHHRDPE